MLLSVCPTVGSALLIQSRVIGFHVFLDALHLLALPSGIGQAARRCLPDEDRFSGWRNRFRRSPPPVHGLLAVAAQTSDQRGGPMLPIAGSRRKLFRLQDGLSPWR